MAELGLHPRDIPADNHRHSREHRQNIRNELRLADGKEQQHEQRPDMQEHQITHIVDTAVLHRGLHCLRQHARPREHAQNYYWEIIPEGHAVSMLCRRKARDIMEAQERVDEVHAMHRVHCIIPRRRNKEI